MRTVRLALVAMLVGVGVVGTIIVIAPGASLLSGRRGARPRGRQPSTSGEPATPL